MLFGNYVANGKVRLTKTLAEMNIDDVGGLTDAEKQATIKNLLGARSGVYHEASNSGDDLASAPPRGSQKPGAYYLYSNWDFNALAGLGIYRELARRAILRELDVRARDVRARELCIRDADDLRLRAGARHAGG